MKQGILGLDLIGKTFFSADDEPGSLPVHCTVTATGDPRKYMKRGKKRLVPILEVSVVTAEMGNNEFESHETEVKEVRDQTQYCRGDICADASQNRNELAACCAFFFVLFFSNQGRPK